MSVQLAVGSVLKGAWAWACEDFLDKELALDRIVLEFGNTTLVLEPLTDTDEIKISIRPSPVDPVPRGEPFLEEFVGQSLRSYWTCNNDRGYFDLLVLGFELFQPAIGVLSEGSSLKVVRMDRLLKGRP